jgi:hypothetical protein
MTAARVRKATKRAKRAERHREFRGPLGVR